MGNLLSIILVSILLILLVSGIYFITIRVSTGFDLFNQIQTKMEPFCPDKDKLDNAVSCLAGNLANQFGVSRADEIVKGQNVSLAESAQLTFGLLECSFKCGANPSPPSKL